MKTIDAQICLYGASKFAYIAQTRSAKEHLKGGWGEDDRPTLDSMTSALFLACADLKAKGATMAYVFAPGGTKRAVVDVQSPPYAGDLKWERC